MLAFLCIFCTTLAIRISEFHGASKGLPAAAVVLASYLMPSSISLWIQLDARKRRRRVAYDFDTLIFFFWPIVAPVYLYRTRGREAIKPVAAFIGVGLLAHLFALVLGYPESMSGFRW